MNFPPNTLRWGPTMQEEISRGRYPFPLEYPLAVCLRESGGVVGNVNPTSGASGLMQIMPVTLGDYNKYNSPNISLFELRSPDPRNAAKQMRVGLWVMGRYLKRGFEWIDETNPNPALSDLIKISDLMYVRGPAGVRDDFRGLTSRTFNDLVEYRPNYQPFAHPRFVWKWTMVNNNPVWDMNAIDKWVTGETQPPPPEQPPAIANTKTGFLTAIMILAVTSYFLQKNKS